MELHHILIQKFSTYWWTAKHTHTLIILTKGKLFLLNIFQEKVEVNDKTEEPVDAEEIPEEVHVNPYERDEEASVHHEYLQKKKEFRMPLTILKIQLLLQDMMKATQNIYGSYKNEN